MVWRDSKLARITCPYKLFYYATSLIIIFLSYMTIESTINESNIEDKIASFLILIFYIYYGIGNLIIILKGKNFIKEIRNNEDIFSIKNIFNKELNFNIHDIELVEQSKNSRLMNYFLMIFRRGSLGVDFYLKNGKKFFISPYMNNIDSLRAHLNEATELQVN